MDDPRLDEMAQALERIRERVSARHPSGELAQTRIPLVDLLPLLHARDAAEAKVAAIGTVNPRPAGIVNSLIQSSKRAIARFLNWFVRDQVEFNRAMLSCTQATLDSLNEFNRLAVDLNDLHEHSIEWRRELESKFAASEIRHLRAVGDLEASYLQRLTQLESTFRELLQSQVSSLHSRLAAAEQHALAGASLEAQWATWSREADSRRESADAQFRGQIGDIEVNFRNLVQCQHREFASALEHSIAEVQKSFWNDLETLRGHLAADMVAQAQMEDWRRGLERQFDQLLSQKESGFRELVRSQHHDFESALERSIADVQKRFWDDLEGLRQHLAADVAAQARMEDWRRGLETQFDHRLTHQESGFRELVRSQHRDFEVSLERSLLDIQKQIWADLGKIRLECDRMIHSELRLLRQRSALAPLPPVTVPPPQIDPLSFGDRFRGSEEYVKADFADYIDYFSGRGNVLDVGCGRGEFLELARERGIGVAGIDSNPEAVEVCRAKDLQAEPADLFEYLARTPELSLDGLFCAQVIEHLPPERVPELIRLAAAALAPGAPVLFETPNPECLAIFATHFYLDPTHTRPVPARLLTYYLEEAGFGGIAIDYRQSADPARPLDAANALDYALRATKL